MKYLEDTEVFDEFGYIKDTIKTDDIENIEDTEDMKDVEDIENMRHGEP